MKIQHGRRTKQIAKREWHKWFAWYPINLGDGNTIVWLDYVYRKNSYYGKTNVWHWIYSITNPILF